MIRSLTVTNHMGEAITFELGSPEKSGFLIQSIDGLGPAKATINATEVATFDGSLYNSSRIAPRNIVIKALFLWNPTIEDARQMSYKYFPQKKKIHLVITTDNRICETDGYVESNEPNIFSKEEGTSISIICPDPYLYSIERTDVVFSGIEPEFEFPFSNESLTENLLEIGETKNSTVEVIPYDGDADIGILITIHILGAVSNITIYNVDTRESMKINTAMIQTLTGTALAAGDDIIISTTKGSKSVRLLRGGTYYNILNSLDKTSAWLQLSKGNNTFAYIADTGVDQMEFAISCPTIFAGV